MLSAGEVMKIICSIVFGFFALNNISAEDITLARSGSLLSNDSLNIVFTIQSNGDLTHLIGSSGNVAYTVFQAGSFKTLLDSSGNSVFNVTDLGSAWILSPIESSVVRRSQVHKQNRQQAENDAQLHVQRTQGAYAEMAKTLRLWQETTRGDFNYLRKLGFTTSELERLDRVMEKGIAACERLSKRPMPVRSMTGLMQSKADYNNRLRSWKDNVGGSQEMLVLCSDEFNKFIEKRDALKKQGIKSKREGK